MKILITGTPGTGKTTIAKELADRLKLKIITNEELKTLITGKGSFGENIIDETKINNLLKKEDNYIFDSHMSQNVKNADYCFVLTCEQKELLKRMEKKGFEKGKIEKNLEAENMKECYIESLENGYKPIMINTTNKKAQETVQEILKNIKN